MTVAKWIILSLTSLHSRIPTTLTDIPRSSPYHGNRSWLTIDSGAGVVGFLLYSIDPLAQHPDTAPDFISACCCHHSRAPLSPPPSSIIADDFHNYSESNWVVITYLLTYSSFLMVYARLSDITGRKPALLTGLCIFTVSSLACGLTRTLTQLYVSPMSAGLENRWLMRGEHY